MKFFHRCCLVLVGNGLRIQFVALFASEPGPANESRRAFLVELLAIVSTFLIIHRALDSRSQARELYKYNLSADTSEASARARRKMTNNSAQLHFIPFCRLVPRARALPIDLVIREASERA